jgi:hypothetical protein
MKKLFLIVVVIIAVYAGGCSPLKRNNPVDPSASNYYIGVTYKGDLVYPDGMQIKDMVYAGTALAFAANKAGYGDCVVKGAGGNPIGNFNVINSVCADSAGNVYAADKSDHITKIDALNNITQWTLTNSATIDRLYIEWLNGYIYVSSNEEHAIFKYGADGGYVDSISLSVTASGYFTPGKIFRSNGSLFVVGLNDARQAVKISPDMHTVEDLKFGDQIIAGCFYGNGIQVLCQQAAHWTDAELNNQLTWGDYGQGPGRILNGRLIACDPAGVIYAVDGTTIKMFGE